MRRRVIAFCSVICMLILLLPAGAADTASEGVVIYEVYTSGGYDSGKNQSAYKNCYVVLYNTSSSDIDLSGWSLKYIDPMSDEALSSAPLEGTIGANKFYVIEGGTCIDPADPPTGTELPFAVNVSAPDLKFGRKTGKIALCDAAGATAAKVKSADSFVVDFLGYGEKDTEVNDYEAAPADGITVKRIYRRISNKDTNNNNIDFDTIDFIDNPHRVVIYDESMTAKPIATVLFSEKAGWYKQAFNLSLSTNLSGADIYYTIDGSEPINEDGSISPTAKKYDDTKKIRIYDRTGEPTNMMHIEGTISEEAKTDKVAWPPVKLANESDYAYNLRITSFFDSIFKINSVKAAAKNGSEISETVYNSYVVSAKNFEERFDLPVICITTDKDNLYNPETGIWIEQNLQKTGSQWERPAEIQFFEKDGTLGFEDTIDIRLNGGFTRGYPQKAIRVYMDHTLHYDLFDGRVTDSAGKKITSFDNFLLRSSGNDWYGSSVRDVFGQEIFSSIGTFDTIGYRPCVAFVNGEYWGIYDIRERVDQRMFARHYDISKDDVVVCENFQTLSDGETGDERPLRDLIAFIINSDMTQPENYARFEEEIEADGFIDYVIAMVYVGYDLFPANNVKMWRNKNPENGVDTKWHMILNDLDKTFRRKTFDTDHLNIAMTIESRDRGKILYSLMQSVEFREKYIARCNWFIENVFIAENIKETLFDMQAMVKAATPEHRERWALSMTEYDKTYAESVEFIEKRTPNMTLFMQRNIFMVSTETDSAMGTLYADGKALDKSSYTNFLLGDQIVRLKAVPKAGYSFAGFEFTAVDTTKKVTTSRNDALFKFGSGGTLRAVFVKTGESATGYDERPALSESLTRKLTGGMVLALRISDSYSGGKLILIDETNSAVAPQLIDERTLVPARFITEKLGGTLQWDAPTSTGTCKMGDNTVQFTTGSNIMMVNGAEVEIDVPSMIIEGRTLLPLRAFCESLGYIVTWDGAHGMIILTPARQNFDERDFNNIYKYLIGDMS